MTADRKRSDLVVVQPGDDRPRILDDDQATIADEYGISAALEAAKERWQETAALQHTATMDQLQLLRLDPILLELQSSFEAACVAAQANYASDPTQQAAEALQRARERLQVVSGGHAPVDEELHEEHKALSPVLESLQKALAAVKSFETDLAKNGRLPWYRRRAQAPQFWKRKHGPVTVGHALDGKWMPGHEDTGLATRSDEVWFARAGADPMVALLIALNVMNAVRPPPVRKRRGQFEDEQINRVLELMKCDEVDLPIKKITALLLALGYRRAQVSEPALNRRLKTLRDRGHVQPVRKTAHGRVIGRRRAVRGR